MFQRKAGKHGGIHAGVGAAEEYRGWMLGAPPANRHVNDGNIDGGEDGKDRSEGLGLAGGGEAAQHEVADVEEPEEEQAGEARVPCPPDAPAARPQMEPVMRVMLV